jgi:hypothetical protein
MQNISPDEGAITEFRLSSVVTFCVVKSRWQAVPADSLKGEVLELLLWLEQASPHLLVCQTSDLRAACGRMQKQETSFPLKVLWQTLAASGDALQSFFMAGSRLRRIGFSPTWLRSACSKDVLRRT